jgi:uncharacterized protein YjbJ (UPF0337 family)
MNAPRIECATWRRRLPPSRVAESEPRRKSGVFLWWDCSAAQPHEEEGSPVAEVPQERCELRTVCRTQAKEMEMDWNRVEGNWKQVKGKIKEKWGNLTDDDLTAINGKRDQLEGKIQERYGIAKDQVKKDVDDWYETQTW